MNVRTIAGIIVGLGVWWIQFFLVTFTIVLAWPGSDEFRQALFEDGDYSVLPTSLLVVYSFMYIVIGLVTGGVTVAITRNARHAWVVAIPLLLFAVFQHFYTLWDVLPAWYNVAVVVLIWPFILMGGWMKNAPTNG